MTPQKPVIVSWTYYDRYTWTSYSNFKG